MLQDLIALAIVSVTAVWLIRHFVRMAKSGGCGSGCDCAQDTKSTAISDRGLKQTPLITPEQVGLPPPGQRDPVD